MDIVGGDCCRWVKCKVKGHFWKSGKVDIVGGDCCDEKGTSLEIRK